MSRWITHPLYDAWRKASLFHPDVVSRGTVIALEDEIFLARIAIEQGRTTNETLVQRVERLNRLLDDRCAENTGLSQLNAQLFNETRQLSHENTQLAQENVTLLEQQADEQTAHLLLEKYQAWTTRLAHENRFLAGLLAYDTVFQLLKHPRRAGRYASVLEGMGVHLAEAVDEQYDDVKRRAEKATTALAKAEARATTAERRLRAFESFQPILKNPLYDGFALFAPGEQYELWHASSAWNERTTRPVLRHLNDVGGRYERVQDLLDLGRTVRLPINGEDIVLREKDEGIVAWNVLPVGSYAQRILEKMEDFTPQERGYDGLPERI